MKKLLSRLIWLPLGLIFVMFLVANRQPVSISFDPISIDHPAVSTPPLPLWIWLVLALLTGIFTGACGMWISGRSIRRKRRAERRELKALKREKPPAPPAAETPPPSLPSLQAP